MIEAYSTELAQHITRIVASAPKGATKNEKAFVHAYYAFAPLSDIAALDAAYAYGLAADAFAFAQEVKGDAPKIAVEVLPRAQGISATRVMTIIEDMPFLVDSLLMLMHRIGLTPLHTLHPILTVTRDAKGVLQTVDAEAEAKGRARYESHIAIELSALPTGMRPEDLVLRIRGVLGQVAAGCRDWMPMRKATLALADTVAKKTPKISADDAAEAADFLRWLEDKHFVFLGLNHYTVNTKGMLAETGKALGLFSTPRTDSIEDAQVPIEYVTTTLASGLITITKSSEPSQVHRAVPMDLITVRQHDAKGAVVGETRILGLFTSNVYYQTTDAIPLLRGKVARVIARSGFDPVSHNGKSLKAILEFLPRDELFQHSDDHLFGLGMGVLSLESRPKVRLFARLDPFGRYVSCLAYVPRERFVTELRQQIEQLLSHAYRGRVITYYTWVSDSPLARVNILIATNPAKVPKPDLHRLEEEITALACAWPEALRAAFNSAMNQSEAQSALTRYRDAFPPNYVHDHTGFAALCDMRRIEEALEGDGLALELYHQRNKSDNIHLKCYSTDTESTLSDVVPILENMGAKLVEVRPYLVTPAGSKPVLVRDFLLRISGAAALDLDAHKVRIEQAIGAVWRKQVANDPFNGLLFLTALNVREVEYLRLYSRYLRQANFTYGQVFVARALNAHPTLAAALVAYFRARFDPAIKAREAAMELAKSRILGGLEAVSNLAEDRVIRRFLELMEATLRTNAFQTLGDEKEGKSYLSIKLRSADVPELPLPRPYAEIFVYSMRMEGIHLRGDTVARGGLRWSDRPEDFRTEVLGLMKAQMVKNAVIVPAGSKGGFIVKRATQGREALMEEGIACYKEFLRGLLDITDNIVGAKVVPPKDTVRHDGDDPYLVVAADKGTASFSDFANGVSAEYGFWLGDAFASGGSAGYDHKEMAITARGGWVAVERHFREMGHDMQTPFTVAGIGDMSGDVFGNAMLLSPQIQLVAAFNHKHIFLDPAPDVAKSFKERTRLFALKGSGWNDYDTKRISKGGGVFERSVKSIALSKEIQAVLGTQVKQASPDELIQIILKAPVDLLWNGGIGTYVKATSETHDEVGDRTNNALRVDGIELRARVVGEGGNLGFTQRGRIEYARTGGRINTDAIDNSAGVDCSDHEVNLKIALGAAVQAKRLSVKERNVLLKKMEHEVAHLVLEDNRLQTQALSLAEAQKSAVLDPAQRFMQTLEASGFLNRAVEFLPSDKDLSELKQAHVGLSRPVLAVLLAYSKMALYRDVKTASALDAAYYEADLMGYFPEAAQKKHKTDILKHRLRREIVATVLSNELVNRLGFALPTQLADDTGTHAVDVVQSYCFMRDVLGMDALWKAVEALDGQIAFKTQIEMFQTIQNAMEDAVRWSLDALPQPLKLAAMVARFAPVIALVRKDWRKIASADVSMAIEAKAAAWVSAGVPSGLANAIAGLDMQVQLCAVVESTGAKKAPVVALAAMYFAVGNALDFDRLRSKLAQLPQDSRWQRQAVQAAQSELAMTQQRLVAHILARYGSSPDAPAQWLRAQGDAFTRYQRFLAGLLASESFDASMLMVALREVALLVE